jgi:hypothetical protein
VVPFGLYGYFGKIALYGVRMERQPFIIPLILNPIGVRAISEPSNTGLESSPRFGSLRMKSMVQSPSSEVDETHLKKEMNKISV